MEMKYETKPHPVKYAISQQDLEDLGVWLQKVSTPEQIISLTEPKPHQLPTAAYAE
jgi:hypothetical protein